jgi:hypothetical protein
MNKYSLAAALLLMTATLSSCELIGDIFQAGFSVGVFVVIFIVILILFFVFRGRK